MSSRPPGAAFRAASARKLAAAVSPPALLLAALLGCGEGAPFTPPAIACPEGALPEFTRFSDARVQSRRPLSDVAWRCLRSGIRHGPSREWFASGQVSAYTEWWEGEKHGRFQMWYPNGQKRSEGAHSHWTPVGIWTTWDEAGNVTSTTDFGTSDPGPEASESPQPLPTPDESDRSTAPEGR